MSRKNLPAVVAATVALAALASPATAAEIEAKPPEPEQPAEPSAPPAKPAPAAKPRQLPSLGRVVHVHFADEREPSGFSTRAAIVCRVWSDTCVNLQVFLDGANDHELEGAKKWLSNVQLSDEPRAGAWSWPPFVPSK